MFGLFSKSFNPDTDLPDLHGKVILITGANSGVGYASVKYLARRGAKVYLGARSEAKATDAIARLKAEGLGPGDGEVVWLNLSLSDPRDAKKAAEHFLTLENRLDVLMNNAGSMVHSDVKSPDGVLEIMVVNHISPFVLTRTLLPLLKKTASLDGSDVRIVNVASNGHTFVPSSVRFRTIEDLNYHFDGLYPARLRRYFVTKLANMLTSFELQRRLDAEEGEGGSPIIVMPVHPGPINSGWAEDTPFPRVASVVGSFFLRHPDVAVRTQVFAAASSSVREKKATYKGAYLVPECQIGQASDSARNLELAKELWETTEAFLASINL